MNLTNMNGTAKGILLDVDFVLGELTMSGKRGDVMERDAEGNVTEDVRKMKYDLRSRGQGIMIQVGIPADAPVAEIPQGTKVKLVNPVFGAVAEPTFGTNAKVEWFINADNIVAVGGMNPNVNNNSNINANPGGNGGNKHQEQKK